MVPPHRGEEVRRSQETRRLAGLLPVRTVMCEPAPLGQSAELQRRRLLAEMTTDTNFVPMLNRQGWLAVEEA